MADQVLTEVSATVAADRESDLLTGFQRLLSGPKPEGLLRTELLSGADGIWRIQTLWRDVDALQGMRSASQPPAAPALFRSVGAEPTLQVFQVRKASQAP